MAFHHMMGFQHMMECHHMSQFHHIMKLLVCTGWYSMILTTHSFAANHFKDPRKIQKDFLGKCKRVIKRYKVYISSKYIQVPTNIQTIQKCAHSNFDFRRRWTSKLKLLAPWRTQLPTPPPCWPPPPPCRPPRVIKSKNFPDSKIFTAKTFRIKCVNCVIDDFATNARKT